MERKSGKGIRREGRKGEEIGRKGIGKKGKDEEGRDRQGREGKGREEQTVQT